MDVVLYSFPTKADGVFAVEQRFCELLSQYRNGEKLDEIEIDWLDSANTWLMNTGSTSNEI